MIIWALLLCLLVSCHNPLDMNDQFERNNPEEYQQGLERMAEAKAALHTLADVRALMGRFRYVTEPVGWTPTIEVMFARDLTDDCDGAAVLGEWALEQIGIPARTCSLVRTGYRHAVAISRDNTIMISNAEVVEIPPQAWVEAVLTWFEPPYTTLVDGNTTWHKEDR